MKTHIASRIMASATAFLALGVAIAGPRQADRRITLTVHRVQQLNNLDADPPLVKDDADFYALIWIDGKQYKTKNFSHDEGRPYWTITGYSSRAVVPIRIRLMDDDGGMEVKDDHLDINPDPDEEDIVLNFRPASGMVSGSLASVARRIVTTEGSDGNRKARISFSIE